MRRVVKAFYYVVFGIVSIILTLSVSLYFFSNQIAEKIRPNLESKLGELLGAEIRFDHLHFLITPHLEIRLDEIVLSPNASCGQIKAKSLELGLKLGELLRRRIKIKYIQLIRPEIDLVKKGGQVRLAGASQSPDGCQNDSDQPEAISVRSEPSSQASEPVNLEIELDQIEILNATVRLQEGGILHHLKIPRIVARPDIKAQLIRLSALLIDAEINKTKYVVSAKEASFDMAVSKVGLLDLKVEAGDENLVLNGTADIGFGSFDIDVSSRKLGLASLGPIAGLFVNDLPGLKNGSVSFELNSSRKNGQLSLAGRVALLDVETKLNKLKFTKLDLSNIKASYTSVKGTNLAAGISINNFHILDGNTAYRLARANGELSGNVLKSGASEFKGGISVNDFAFNDGLTKIEKASALLKDIRFRITASGDTDATLNLDGNSILLSHPSTEVKAVRRILAPIKVKVPAKGGYSVSGPVTVQNGLVIALGKTFSEVSGTVDMLVSGPLKTFSSKNLATVSQNRKISGQVAFSMRPRNYKVSRSVIGINSGQFVLAGEIERVGSRKFCSEISIEKLALADILSVFEQKEENEYSAILNELTAKLCGRMPNPLTTLEGQGSFKFSQSLLKSFNFSAELGRALALIPFVGARLAPESLEGSNTIESAVGQFEIKNEVITFPTVTVKRNRYSLKGKGTLDFKQNIDAQASVIFLQDTFESLGGGLDKVGAILGKAGRVSIPIFIKGKVSSPSITPDTATLVKDNSGINLIGSVLSGAAEAGGAVGRMITGPFRSKKEAQKDDVPLE